MFRRTAVIACVIAGAAALGMGTAAADEWPTPPPYPSPSAPQDVTGLFLTPQDPDYWNPFVSENRLTSPTATAPASCAPDFTACSAPAGKPIRMGTRTS